MLAGAHLAMRARERLFGTRAQRMSRIPVAHEWVSLSFQQPTFQKFTKQHILLLCLKHVDCLFVVSEIMKCRLLKSLLDHPMSGARTGGLPAQIHRHPSTRAMAHVRPISLLRFWISEGVTQAES